MSLKNKKKEKKIECEGRWRKAVKVGEQGYFGGRIIHWVNIFYNPLFPLKVFQSCVIALEDWKINLGAIQSN